MTNSCLSFLLILTIASCATSIPVNEGSNGHLRSSPPIEQKPISLFGATVQLGKLHPAPSQQSSSSSATLQQRKGGPPFGDVVQAGRLHPSTSRTYQKNDGIKLFGGMMQTGKLPFSLTPEQTTTANDKKQKSTFCASRLHPEMYNKLFQRLNLSHNYCSKSRLLKSLTEAEKQAVETGDEAGIKALILSRGHLVRYAPLEFPQGIRPDEDRIKRMQSRFGKKWRQETEAKFYVHGRHKKGWYNAHTREEAEAIRTKTVELHGLQGFERQLNAKIAKMTPAERRLALENDHEAVRRLGPLNRPRNSKGKKRERPDGADQGDEVKEHSLDQ